MTATDTHAARRSHPASFDSIDFYTRHGHALHARAAREGFGLIWQALRDFVRR